MKKAIALMTMAAGVMFGASFTGVISDSGCKGDHAKMNMGTDEKCVTGCVKGMGAKYVLWDGKNAYTLSDQATPANFAAKKVTVMGTLDAKTNTIKVDSITAAK